MARLVMLIDGSPTICKILETCLHRAGYEVNSFPDGVQALLWLKSSEARLPALIFVDLGLPKLDGYEVILVHLSFLGRSILMADYPALAQACAALCRPGGIVCWTEAELPVTTSPAFQRLTSLVLEGLQKDGQSFILERVWELTELIASRSGRAGVERSSYQRRHLGITPMLGRWLRDAGCGAQRERPLFSIWGIDERVIHETVYAIEVSAGQPAHEAFVAQARRFAHQVKSFLLRTGVIEEREHAALCDQLETELTNQEFCGLSFLLRAWAPRL